MRVGVDQRLADHRERVGVVEVEHVLAGGKRATEIDAELLDDVALDLGDGDLEHHLVAAAHRDAVDDLVAVAGEAGGEIVGLLRFGLARHRAGQHDAVGEALDAMSASGIDRLSAARMPLRSRVTAMSKAINCLPSASKK